jgi:hypothetical protein
LEPLVAFADGQSAIQPTASRRYGGLRTGGLSCLPTLAGPAEVDQTVFRSGSHGEIRWNEQTAFRFAAILAGLALLNIFVLVALVFAIVMAEKIASEQQAVIYSRYLDAIDQKLEDQYMKEALLGRAKAGQSYFAQPLSEKDYTPEVREQVAEAWTGGNVAVVAQPRRSGTPAPAANPPTPPTS